MIQKNSPRRIFGNDPFAYYQQHYAELTRGQLRTQDKSLYYRLRSDGLLVSVPTLSTSARKKTKLFNARLFNARESLGVGVKQVAAKIGIDTNYYFRIENLIDYPHYKTQRKICEFYRSKGIPLVEKDVFPKELHQIIRLIKEGYRTEIPQEELISLSSIDYKLLPLVDSPEQNVIPSGLTQKIDKVLAELTPRQEKVIKMRFGFGKYKGTHTLEEIGQEMGGLTKERIRQIEKKALRRLRHPSRARKLRDFY